MSVPKQETRRRGYRDVTLLDRRGHVLAYVDTLAVHQHTVGLTRATFGPKSISRLSTGRAQVTVLSRGRAVLVLKGLRLGLHTGGDILPEGGWICEAAVGIFVSAERP